MGHEAASESRASVNIGGGRATAVPSLGQRRRIWEIDTSMYCSILGTRLTMSDLYVIARRARCRLDPAASAYRVHSSAGSRSSR